ncbi:MAG: CapA family protein [Fibrobacterota bacterium]
MKSHFCTLGAVGDIMLHGAIADKIGATSDPLYSFRPVLPILKDCDILFGNLETMVTLERKAWPGTPNRYFSPIGTGKAMAKAGFKVLNIGHNHSYDWGNEGVETTVDELKSAGILFGGLQKKGVSEAQPIIVQCSCGKRFGFLFYCLTYNTLNTKHGYYAIAPDTGRVKRDIASLSGKADIIVASVHGGTCMNFWPAPDMLKGCRVVSDAGADIVLGHHAHVMNGIEKRGHRLICYALPDFVRPFPFGTDEVTEAMRAPKHESLMVKINISQQSEITHEAIPLVFDDKLQTRPALPDEGAVITSRLEALSRDIASGQSNAKYYAQAQASFKEAYAANLWIAFKRGGIGWLVQRLMTLRPHHLKILVMGITHPLPPSLDERGGR